MTARTTRTRARAQCGRPAARSCAARLAQASPGPSRESSRAPRRVPGPGMPTARPGPPRRARSSTRRCWRVGCRRCRSTAYQAGILPTPQRQAIVVSFDVTAQDRGELTGLLRTLTTRAQFLTAGGTPPPAGLTGPPSDSGVLGPVVVPDGLTVTVGVGPSLFDGRFGLAGRKPAHLDDDDAVPQRPSRPGPVRRRPEPAAAAGSRTRSCTRCATSPGTPGAPCSCAGASTASPARPARRDTPRNLLGFKDGIANPTPATPRDGQPRLGPAWRRRRARLDRGGSYQVIRLIRMLVEFWDRVSAYRAGEHDRPAPGHRCSAGRQHGVRHPRLRRRPHRWRHSARRAHPAGKPAHPATDGAGSCAAATTTTGAWTTSATSTWD